MAQPKRISLTIIIFTSVNFYQTTQMNNRDNNILWRRRRRQNMTMTQFYFIWSNGMESEFDI